MENYNIIKEKTMDFAIRVVNLHKYLKAQHQEYVMSKQLLRSGTSTGANTREAINAESKADFIHKLGIVQKEADESCFWIELLYRTDYISEKEYKSIYHDANEILKITKSIIISSKKNEVRKKIISSVTAIFATTLAIFLL